MQGETGAAAAGSAGVGGSGGATYSSTSTFQFNKPSPTLLDDIFAVSSYSGHKEILSAARFYWDNANNNMVAYRLFADSHLDTAGGQHAS